MCSAINSDIVERPKKGRKTEVTKFSRKNKGLSAYINPSNKQNRQHILSPVSYKITDTSAERLTCKKVKRETGSQKRNVSKSPVDLQ